MHGISAFGTNMCSYELEIVKNPIISPPPAAEYSRIIQVVDAAPENWWNLNILDQEGYVKFMEVVEQAKAVNLLESQGYRSPNAKPFECDYALAPPGTKLKIDCQFPMIGMKRDDFMIEACSTGSHLHFYDKNPQ